jgi:hypothetical protein
MLQWTAPTTLAGAHKHPEALCFLRPKGGDGHINLFLVKERNVLKQKGYKTASIHILSSLSESRICDRLKQPLTESGLIKTHSNDETHEV